MTSLMNAFFLMLLYSFLIATVQKKVNTSNVIFQPSIEGDRLLSYFFKGPHVDKYFI